MTMPPEHDFTLPRDEWEKAVFDNAAYFRLNLYMGNERYTAEMESFSRAVDAARQILETSKIARVLLYAITSSGRSVVVPVEKWDDYLESWKSKQ